MIFVMCNTPLTFSVFTLYAVRLRSFLSRPYVSSFDIGNYQHYCHVINSSNFNQVNFPKHRIIQSSVMGLTKKVIKLILHVYAINVL